MHVYFPLKGEILVCLNQPQPYFSFIMKRLILIELKYNTTQNKKKLNFKESRF